MERGGSNLSDKGLNSVDRGSKATLPLTIPRRRFKSPAKDSTRRRGNNNSRRSERALTNGLSQRHAPLGAGSYRGRIPLSALSSELAVRRQETPESCSQSAPADTRRAASPLAARAVRQQSTGSNWDLRAQPSEPILFRLRIHFADFLAYIVPSTRGCSPWRPDAL
ncbi:hypothetical protein Bca4012_103426 [Brassica carinata]